MNVQPVDIFSGESVCIMVTDPSEEFVVAVLVVHLSTSQLSPVQTCPSGSGKLP